MANPDSTQRIDESTVRRVFDLSDGGVSKGEIARRLGISRLSVRQMLCGMTWSHVDPERPRHAPIQPSRRKRVAIQNRPEAALVKQVPEPVIPSSPEEWREIPFAPGYDVSSHGRVGSRRIRYGRGGIGTESRILALGTHKYGYPTCGFYVNGKHRLVVVHQLVARTFLGDPPPDKPMVLHRDDDPTNNCVDNLRWGSPKENQGDMVAHGRSRYGTRQSKRLDESKVAEIVKMYDDGVGARTIAKRFGIGRTTVMHIVNGRTWKHVTVAIVQSGGESAGTTESQPG